MRAAYPVAKRQFEIRDISQPQIENETDVLLPLRSSGVCGSGACRCVKGRPESLEATFPMMLGQESCAVKLARVKPTDGFAGFAPEPVGPLTLKAALVSGAGLPRATEIMHERRLDVAEGTIPKLTGPMGFEKSPPQHSPMLWRDKYGGREALPKR